MVKGNGRFQTLNNCKDRIFHFYVKSESIEKEKEEKNKNYTHLHNKLLPSFTLLCLCRS